MSRETPKATRPDHKGYKVVALLLGLSIVFGATIAWRLRTSESHLTGAVADMETRGVELDVAGCLDATIEWYSGCEAMAGLCDQSIARVMGACLSGGDHSEYCEGVRRQSYTTRFGNDDCRSEERGLDRHLRRACAASYRAIHVHCATENAPPAVSP